MNFFEHQEQSKKKSGLLVFLFIMAVAALILTCYVLIMVAINFKSKEPVGWVDLKIFAMVAGAVGGVILIAALIRIATLKHGGSYVAESLGGSRVDLGTKDPLEKRLLNVVQEMALASGVPVPPVYVMRDEEGINAFAAGHSVNDAAVAVTSGCLKTLNRDELQGVIAHEFSHILNGDMKLNIRIMGFLGGILALAIIGYQIMRFTPRRSKNAEAAFFIGLALVVVGYAGVLIGRIIQAAVSRQREYLADASAVQFTRNPLGIGGALKKIGGFKAGTAVNSPRAAEVGHMFFGNAARGFVSSIFATHPPIEDRIARIEPTFKQELKAMKQDEKAAAGMTQAAAAGMVSGFAGANASAQDSDVSAEEAVLAATSSSAGFSTGSSAAVRTSSEAAVSRSGTFGLAEVEYSRSAINAIPQRLLEHVRNPLGAAASLAAIMLDDEPFARGRQLALLARMAGKEFASETEIVGRDTAGLAPELRLPLADLAMPALRQMSKSQAEAIWTTLQALANADNTITLHELALLKVVELRLRSAFGTRRQGSINDVRKLGDELAVVLRSLAWAGGDQSARSAFLAGRKAVAWSVTPELGEKAFDATVLGNALDRLSMASTNVKKVILRACSETVLADKEVTVEEAELLRTVANCLDLPLPPFLPQ